MNPIKGTDHQKNPEQNGSNMKIGIVINSRLSSSRIPNKAIAPINGVSMIEHLISRLQNTGFPIFVAVPHCDYIKYLFLNERFSNIVIHPSNHSDDPLARMNEVAETYGLDFVVRVTHDKIFVDTEIMMKAIHRHFEGPEKPDYIYLDESVPGTAFEIISCSSLAEASKRFKNVEFIGYAIREVTSKCCLIDAQRLGSQGVRLLVDYPDDLKLMQVLFSQLGNNCSLNDVISYLIMNPDIKSMNRLPKVSVYTCAYNDDRWIGRAIDSVLNQKLINFEYILINDSSTDRTSEIMAKTYIRNKNIRFLTTDKNIGLASASNLALNEATGDYIIRLDADDWFDNDNVLASMVTFASHHKAEIVYPDYFEIGNDIPTSIRSGSDNHHAGGALFHRSGLNYVKFTDGLRGHDSLDVFTRARDVLRIAYFRSPTFNYFQREGSLSRSNLEYRNMIKSKITGGNVNAQVPAN